MMNRYCLLIASLLMLSWLAVAQQVAQQQEKPDSGVSKPRYVEDYWKKHPTELPDLVGPKAEKKLTMPGKLEINEKDSSVIKAVKRAIEADLDTLLIMDARIKDGQGIGLFLYGQRFKVIAGICDKAKLIDDKPEKLLPWAEYRLQVCAKIEEVALGRTQANIEDLTTLPQFRSVRFRAEIEVLTLREKIKK